MEEEKKARVVVAITGGICTGKSTVLKVLAEHGASVFSCDSEIKRLKKVNNDIQQRLKEAFPGAYNDDSKLAEVIFNHEEKRKALEGILYPELEKSRKRFIETNKSTIVFIESPLLYEKKREKEKRKTYKYES